jgi:pyruvate dehydrogenase E1 component alpha subunit
MNPEAVHHALTKAAEHIRAGHGPYFLEINTYRYKGHSVSDPGNYRTKEELKSYMEIDPVKVLERRLTDEKIASAEEVQAIKDLIKAEIEDAATFAKESPLPDPADLWTDNYVQPDYPFLKD